MSVDVSGEFRASVRAWLTDQPPPGGDGDGVDPAGSLTPDEVSARRAWQRALFDAGLAGIAWPREYGGGGASPTEQLIFQEEYVRAGADRNDLFFVALSHAGPTIIAHGTPAQQHRYLDGILRGELIFCQCFSEPGAGSDLAAVATRAVVEDDELVISGEKRWSTHAQYADHSEMLVRTDSGSKHGGLTFVIGDMRAPGVEIRPLRTMSGEAEFNEVFFDEVRVPLANVIGGIGEGWKVATTTLQYERTTAFAGTVMRLQQSACALAEAVHGDAVAEDAVAGLASRALAVRALLYQSVAQAERGQPNPGAGAIKLLSSELNHELARAALLRQAGSLTDYFRSFGLRIGGGTSEIQRNIIAERILGLPRN